MKRSPLQSVNEEIWGPAPSFTLRLLGVVGRLGKILLLFGGVGIVVGVVFANVTNNRQPDKEVSLASVSSPTPPPCINPQISEESIYTEVSTLRKESSQPDVYKSSALTKYAQLRAEEIAAGGPTDQSKSKYGNFWNWVKGVDTQNEEQMFDLAGGELSVTGTNACQVDALLKGREDELTTSDTQAIGVGISKQVVIIITSHFRGGSPKAATAAVQADLAQQESQLAAANAQRDTNAASLRLEEQNTDRRHNDEMISLDQQVVDQDETVVENAQTQLNVDEQRADDNTSTNCGADFNCIMNAGDAQNEESLDESILSNAQNRLSTDRQKLQQAQSQNRY